MTARLLDRCFAWFFPLHRLAKARSREVIERMDALLAAMEEDAEARRMAFEAHQAYFNHRDPAIRDYDDG